MTRVIFHPRKKIEMSKAQTKTCFRILVILKKRIVDSILVKYVTATAIFKCQEALPEKAKNIASHD